MYGICGVPERVVCEEVYQYTQGIYEHVVLLWRGDRVSVHAYSAEYACTFNLACPCLNQYVRLSS